MAAPGDVLEVPGLGVRYEIRATAAETGGELLEFDVVGRPKGFVTVPHVHPLQSERHEYLRGHYTVSQMAAGGEHRHGAAGDGPARVRFQIRPALRFAEWLERVAQMDRDGELAPGGWPKPVAAARLLLDFPGEAHGAFPPLPLQQAAARAIVKVAQSRR